MKYYKLLLLVISYTALNLKSIVAQQLKPGDIAPNAKVIDADYLFSFNGGAAIVKKGESHGLIDASGNFIVPYNKYRKIVSSATKSGIFIINDNEGAIDSKGKLITAAYPGLSWGYGNAEGTLVRCTYSTQGFIYLDAEGHKYVLKQDLAYIADGIGIAKDPKEGLKKGYKNLKDEWVVSPIYDFAGPFSEGMACVGKRNEFDELRYGFIDRKGKEVIPIMYSFIPENFHGGIARVQPKTNAEFLSAYIDKKGTIVQKFKQVVFFKYIGNGLYSSVYSGEYHIMDSTGKVVPLKDFLQQFGVVAEAADKNVHLGLENTDGTAYEDKKISFGRLPKESGTGNYGFIDLKTKAIMEGLFDHTTLNFFDPVSKLAFAKFNLTKNWRDKTPPREGYVNEQGVFVIVKGEASKW